MKFTTILDVVRVSSTAAVSGEIAGRECAGYPFSAAMAAAGGL